MSPIVKSVMWACVMAWRCGAAENDAVSMLQTRAGVLAEQPAETKDENRPESGWATPVKPKENKGRPEEVEGSLGHVSTAITDADEMDVAGMMDEPEDPDPIVPEVPCTESNWVVKFLLAGQHTYALVPTCIKVTKSFPGPVQPVPWKCGKCATDGAGGLGNFKMQAKINWNTEGCRQEGLCYNATKKADAAKKHKPIGPQGGFKVHPICAWGILDKMDDVYYQKMRVPTNTAGPMMTKPYDFCNTPKGRLAILKAEQEGGQKLAVVTAANSIDWARHLNQECRDPVTGLPDFRSAAKILDKGRQGAVCWNSMQDFRDLMCNYKEEMDVTDDIQCRAKFGPDFELTRR